jgi:hypothetical protein
VNRNVTVPDGNPDTPIPEPYATSEHTPNKCRSDRDCGFNGVSGLTRSL